MPSSLVPALRILAHFWLEEIDKPDLETISAIPSLAQTLPGPSAESLTELAVEYQRLFGFNLPPYESVFLDPSAMLMAPSTERLRILYRQGNWSPPATVRAGAPDHLGLELYALGDGIEAERDAAKPAAATNSGPDRPRQHTHTLAHRLQTEHLALWVPAFVLSLKRLDPHPFYTNLGELTLDLILSTLPEDWLPADGDPFRPTSQLYSPQSAVASSESGSFISGPEPGLFDLHSPGSPIQLQADDELEGLGLREIVTRLLSPCLAGLYLTREDMARLGQALKLPGVVGGRYTMLATLFRLAAQSEQVPLLIDRLEVVITAAGTDYRACAGEFPTWAPYAQAWCSRIDATLMMLADLWPAEP
jgi:TorA maturation chaperone TorD